MYLKAAFVAAAVTNEVWFDEFRSLNSELRFPLTLSVPFLRAWNRGAGRVGSRLAAADAVAGQRLLQGAPGEEGPLHADRLTGEHQAPAAAAIIFQNIW